MTRSRSTLRTPRTDRRAQRSRQLDVDSRRLERVRARIESGYYERPEVLRDLASILLEVLDRPDA